MAFAAADPMELPVRRLINVARAMWLETYAEEHRERLALILAWPEDREKAEAEHLAAERAAEDAERASHVTAAAATFGLDQDKMWDRQVRARELALAEIAENKRQAEAKRIRDDEDELLNTSPREWADEAAAAVERESA